MTDVARALLPWYDRHRRRLPWRAGPGERTPAYAVWLSEIMLQQTTVAAVGPYYQRFLDHFPTVADLAAAPLDQVLTLWAGLGYYARARNLHRCAQVIVRDFAGIFPDDEATLLSLPGVGAYTAAAIAAIAFDRRAVVVDGNVERVVSRLAAIATPLPAAKPEIRRLADQFTPEERPGDYAQAMMDLGASLCSVTNPGCTICPLLQLCRAAAQGEANRFPVKLPKAAKPTRRGVAFWLRRGDGAVLLRRRPERGLLGGMMEVPSTEWSEGLPDANAIRAAAPLTAEWRPIDGLVRHTFTHFHLELSVVAATVRLGDGRLGRWVTLDQLGEVALPTLFRKVVKHALTTATS